MSKRKSSINIIVIGHVNSGKATTIGHLIYKCGIMNKHVLEHFEKESIRMDQNKSAAYTWILEKLKSQYECGDPINQSLCRFETNKNCITIINVPGHCNFIKTMIMTPSPADCALLVVSASNDEFEMGISKNGQTFKHIELIHALGVQQMIVAVNKIDTTMPPFSEERFEQIKNEISNYIKEISYQLLTIIFIPISGLYGYNLVESSDRMTWFAPKSIACNERYTTGRTILEALDAIVPLDRHTSRPFRMPLDDIYKIGGIGTVAVGTVASGILETNKMINFAPSNLFSNSYSLERVSAFDSELGVYGCPVGINVKNIHLQQLQRGLVCSDAKNDPAREVTSAIAYLILLNYPHKICQGYTSTFCCHTARVPCEIVQIIEKIDRRSGKTIEETPKYLKSREAAIAKIVPLQPISFEKFADYPLLGRFFIRDTGQIVAVGIVKDIEKKPFVMPHLINASHNKKK